MYASALSRCGRYRFLFGSGATFLRPRKSRAITSATAMRIPKKVKDALLPITRLKA